LIFGFTGGIIRFGLQLGGLRKCGVMMDKRRGFTLIELLVVIAIIALLMAILMPALARVKKQAKATACQMNLHHWGLIWSMYTGDHDALFPDGTRTVGGRQMGHWLFAVQPYYRDEEIRWCPMAAKPWGQARNPFGAWEANNVAGGSGFFTSYGINNWLYDPTGSSLWGYQAEDHWRNANVAGAGTIPLFLDCFYLGGHPLSTNTPPEYDGQTEGAGSACMRRFCINRHEGRTNMVFLDFAVRKVGLKELWKLKWHRQFDMNDSWTAAGGCQPGDWPEWMRGLKDY